MPIPEKSLIAQLRKLANRASNEGSNRNTGKDRTRLPGLPNPTVLTGIGDDCAVLRSVPGTDLLVTTDFTLEGIHFRQDWHSPESIGHRCLTRGLSDIAAMGGDPVAVFLSLALPRGLQQSWVTRFTRGLLSLASQHGTKLAGGDTAESPAGVLADIVVLGVVPKGKAILRSTARPGDRIFVSGTLGGSAAALVQMRDRNRRKVDARAYPRHFYPEPRVEVGRVLRELRIATAMIDTSDGLSTDLSHICEESGVGAEIDAARIPRARVGRPEQVVPLDLALHGGEDYELLLTVSSDKRVPSQVAGTALTEIGRITRGRKLVLLDATGGKRNFNVRGWEHFTR